jgi:hypothetical protein
MAKTFSVTKVQYDEWTDVVIYGDATKNFTEGGWIRLASAALDQAGVYPHELAAAHKLVGSATGRGVALDKVIDLLLEVEL